MEEFLTVAKIVKPQGIRGEIKVISMTDSVEDLTEFNPQWKDSIEKIKDQIKELDMLRQEGK